MEFLSTLMKEDELQAERRRQLGEKNNQEREEIRQLDEELEKIRAITEVQINPRSRDLNF